MANPSIQAAFERMWQHINIMFSKQGHTHTVANITDLTATATELNYVDGVTNNIQTQLDDKVSKITVVVDSQNYGDTFPLTAVEGQIFFKKVT